MDTAAKVLVFLGSAVAGGAALLVAAEKRHITSASDTPQEGPFSVDLDGALPITIEYVKKPVPAFSVYQY